MDRKKNFIKTLGTLVITAFIFTSCAYVPQEETPCCETENPAFAESQYPLSSFVKLNLYLDETLISSGSGSVIDQDDEASYVLTAAHVCQNRRFLMGALLENKELNLEVADVDGELYQANPYSVNHKEDLCIMRVPGMERPPLKMASSGPIVGDTYHNMASPLGIAQKKAIPIFTGIYSGEFQFTKEHPIHDLYTIPAEGGSSGSAIMNENNEVVGIIVIGFRSLETASISPTYIQTKTFVEETLAHLHEEGE